MRKYIEMIQLKLNFPRKRTHVNGRQMCKRWSTHLQQEWSSEQPEPELAAFLSTAVRRQEPNCRTAAQTEAVSLRDEQALQADVQLSMMSIGFMMFMDTSTYTYKRLFLCRLTQYFAVLS